MERYIIIGSTGEYSDRWDWYVGYVETEEKAKQLVKQYNKWLKDHGLYLGKSEYKRIKPPFDDQFHCDYTGSIYSYSAVSLIE